MLPDCATRAVRKWEKLIGCYLHGKEGGSLFHLRSEAGGHHRKHPFALRRVGGQYIDILVFRDGVHNHFVAVYAEV